MSKPALWTDEEIEQVRKLRQEDKLEFSEIGARMGRSKSAANNVYLRCFGRRRKSFWTPARLKKLKELRDVKKMGFEEISRRIGKPASSLYKVYAKHFRQSTQPKSKRASPKLPAQRSTSSLGPLWRDIDQAKAAERRIMKWHHRNQESGNGANEGHALRKVGVRAEAGSQAGDSPNASQARSA